MTRSMMGAKYIILKLLVLAQIGVCVYAADLTSISPAQPNAAFSDSTGVITTVNQTTQLRVNYLKNLDSNATPWQKLELDGLLERGIEHPLIPEIKRRLTLLQDLVIVQDAKHQPDLIPQQKSAKHNQDRRVFTKNLEVAVIKFQHRHGLKPDGIIGPNTLSWLNVPPKKRAQLLTNNMRRQQDFFERVSDNYLLVNIPQFQLSLIEQGLSVLKSRVIVGKKRRPTPVIDAEIQTLVLNPAWNVPRSIIRRDLLPKIRINTNYLAEGNYEVYDYTGNRLKLADFDWSSLATGRFPYRLRQRPGPTNTLGRVKLYFDNKHSIYLHDTPNKKLFSNYHRAFSSGCVRVEKADELAKWFGKRRIADRKNWLIALNNPYKNRWLKLKAPLALHLVYWTAWLDSANNAQFRTDIYNKESDLSKSHSLIGVSSNTATAVKF